MAISGLAPVESSTETRGFCYPDREKAGVRRGEDREAQGANASRPGENDPMQQWSLTIFYARTLGNIRSLMNPEVLPDLQRCTSAGRMPESQSAVDEKAFRSAEETLQKLPGYENVSDSLKSRIAAFYSRRQDPEVRDSLSVVLKDGRMSGGIMTQLEALERPGVDLAPAINKEALLRQGLRDIAAPQAIGQGGKGTCGATTMQIALAVKNPALYLKILRTLSGGNGDASSVIPGLRRPADAPIEDDGSGRSITTRIISPSFMEYANGDSYDYSNAQDKSSRISSLANLYNLFGDRRYSGLDDEEMVRLYQGITGDGSRIVTGSRMFSSAAGSLREGKTVITSLHWGDGGHWVYLQKLDDRFAYCVNPWGEKHKFALEEYKKNLWSVVISRSGNHYPRPSDIRKWDSYASYSIPEKEEDSKKNKK